MPPSVSLKNSKKEKTRKAHLMQNQETYYKEVSKKTKEETNYSKRTKLQKKTRASIPWNSPPLMLRSRRSLAGRSVSRRRRTMSPIPDRNPSSG